jgi:hypothetical protein
MVNVKKETVKLVAATQVLVGLVTPAIDSFQNPGQILTILHGSHT